MVKAKGLKAWRVEVRGDGRTKKHRYHYLHGLDDRAEFPPPEPQVRPLLPLLEQMEG